MCRIGSGEIDGRSIEGLVASHRPDNFLFLVTVVYERCHHLCSLIGVVGADEEGVIAEQ